MHHEMAEDEGQNVDAQGSGALAVWDPAPVIPRHRTENGSDLIVSAPSPVTERHIRTASHIDH